MSAIRSDVGDFEVTRHGAFVKNNIYLIPYRHYKEKNIWEVKATYKCMSPQAFRIFSPSLQLAVADAYRQMKPKIDKYQQQEESYLNSLKNYRDSHQKEKNEA